MRRIVIVGGGYAGFHGVEAREEASAPRPGAGDHRSPSVHDVPVVPSGGQRRLDRGTARRRVAAKPPAAHEGRVEQGDNDRTRRSASVFARVLERGTGPRVGELDCHCKQDRSYRGQILRLRNLLRGGRLGQLVHPVQDVRWSAVVAILVT